MATPTQTPSDKDKFNPSKSPGDDYWKRQTARYDARQQHATGNPTDPRSNDTAANNPSDPRGELADQEQKASEHRAKNDEDLGTQESRGDANWKNNVDSQGMLRARGGLLKSAVKLRGIGAFLAMVGLMFSIAGIMISLITGALGLVNLKETALGKVSQTASSALENRSIKVMAKKMAGDLTSGCTIKVKCRYRGMSAREIKRFNKRALKSGSGVRIVVDSSRTSLNPLKKPVQLVTFNPSDLKGTDIKPSDVPDKNVRTIAARDVKSTLRSDPHVRQAVRNFYKSKVEFYSGQAGKSVWARTKTFLGKRKTGPGEGDSEEKKQQYRQREMARKATSGAEGDLSAKTASSSGSPDETDAQKTEREEADRKVNQVNGDVKDVIKAEADILNSEKNDYTKNLSTPEPGSEAYAKRYDASVDKVANAGGGALNTVGLGNVLNFMQNVCLVRMLVGAVNDSRPVLQAVQLMQFALLFGTLADRVKAGDADGDTTQQIGDLMSMLNSTDSEGFTAFDSMGYNWVSNGSVRTSGNEDTGAYQNGGSPPGILGPVVGVVVNMGALKSLCGLAMSPAGVAIGIGLTVAGLFSGGAATAVKQVMKEAVEQAAETGIRSAIKKAVGETISKKFLSKQLAKDVAGTGTKLGAMEAFFRFGVPPLIDKIARALTRTVITGDEKGRAVGNAVVSGFGVAASLVGKAQGMQPLSVGSAGRLNAIAYNDQLKIAKEEGVNQFDISNQFSFANKVATTLAPNTARLSSISSLPTMIASIPSLALNNLAGTAQAASDPDAQFKFCKDDALKDAGIAGDPFCNPQYGMDPVVLNSDEFDPEAVTDYLYDNNLIDDDGKPVGDFENFVQKCMQTDTPLGDIDECKQKVDSSVASTGNDSIADSFFSSANAATSVSISDSVKKTTMMRMYCIDTSIDIDMNDGNGTGCSPASEESEAEDATDSTTGGDQQPSASIDMATLYDDSSSIACAAGSKDLGVNNEAYHAGQKFKARLCAIEDVPETGELSDVPGAGGKLVVNSRVSAVIVNMVKDAKAAGISPITAAEGFRSMARQTYLFNCKPGCGVGSNPVADPGTSNHQSGVAIDWNDPMRGWVISNGERYGYKWYGPGDPPHFSPDGR